MPRLRPRLVLVFGVVLCLISGLTSCRSAGHPESAAASQGPTSSISTPTPTPTPTLTLRATPSPGASATSTLSAADQLAGLTSRKIVWRAGGTLHTVPGHQKAPGPGRVYQVRVQVEAGLPIDGAVFATFVLATLNDRRSWTQHGTRTFARTDGPGDFTVVLASPATSAAMCRPLQTFGRLSCHEGQDAVLTMYRWVKGIPGYDGDVTGYRHYVVNHEVGHELGHHHQYCAGPGRLAPLMMQQTKGLKGCRPNPWPFPDA